MIDWYIRSMNMPPFYKQVLLREFSKRIEKNSRYSMRAFAKSLNIDIGALSQILSGKRRLSYKKACEILDRINIDLSERKNFFISLSEEHKKTGNKNISKNLQKILQDTKLGSAKNEREDLSIETYKIISDWYHFAIMELTFLNNFQGTPEWIAKTLGITHAQAKLGLERLLSLELLQDSQGIISKVHDKIISKDRHITNSALKKRLKQIMIMSIAAIDEQDVSERHHATMTVPIQVSKIPEAKRRIDSFLNELADFLEADSKEEVFEIQVSMFSLQKNRSTI